MMTPGATIVLAVLVAFVVVLEMAAGAAKLFGTDLAVATTGYAEPSAVDGVEVPMAWWAVAHRRGRRVTMLSGRVECPGERRVAVQQMVASAVLAELVVYLRELRGEVGVRSRIPG